MRLRWESSHPDVEPPCRGFDRDRFVAQVVRYDVPDGWRAFLSGHPIDGGPWPAIDEAQRAAEATYRRQHT